VRPFPVLWYLALNTERAFADVRLRQAVAHAVDRTFLASLYGFDAATATDQILPPSFPGRREESIYSLTPDLAAARALATAAGVTPATPLTVVMYTFNTAPGPQVADHVRAALAPLGIVVDVRAFDRIVQNGRQATRGEPFDIGLEGWGADYLDPFNVLDRLLNGRRIQPTGNTNISYFDDPVFNARLDAAATLGGTAREDAYAALDRDLTAAAPIVPYINTNARLFFSDRVGCHSFTPRWGAVLNALCLRP
jgi:peptide/nickel transport system substrate-binding protein